MITYVNNNRPSVDIKSVMDKKQITVYQLSRDTGLKYDTINRYYNDNVNRIDLSNLSIICTALDCQINDVIKTNDEKK